MEFLQKKQYFLDLFMKNYYPLLGIRKDSFLKIFHELLKEEKQNYFIIETGTCRLENNFSGDGMSTILWDQFINIFSGKVYSVDINENNVNFSRSKVSDKTSVILSDSVKFLNQLSNDDNLPFIDLLYLDSYDLDWSNPHPSSFHHIKELLAIKSKVLNNTIIVVDDNNKNAGKGRYIDEFMKNLNKTKLIDDYQIAWKW